MKKRMLLPVVLCALLLSMIAGTASAANGNAGSPAPVRIMIDGEYTSLSAPATIRNAQTYVPIREVSTALGATSVTWSGNAAVVRAPGLLIEAGRNDHYLVANGRYLFVKDGFMMKNGCLMVPVRVLAEAFGADVYWLPALSTVWLSRGGGAITPGTAFYSADDVYWLSRIITAEARGESLFGKIAVGNVILNRIDSPLFPNTVYNVIFDRRSGIQFTPAHTGAVYCTPTQESVIAAKIALDGGSVAGDSLYFSSVAQCWAARHRPYTMTIGNHTFFG